MRPSRCHRMDRTPEAQVAARSLLPHHLHRTRRLARLAALAPKARLCAAAQRKRGHLAGCRQPRQISGRPIGPFKRAPYLGPPTPNPHVHCVVPGGGLREDRLRWCRPKTDFFLPYQVLGERFRNRLKTALQGQPDCSQIPAGVWRQKWGVNVQVAGSGEAALKYLSAYVYRTALSSRRLLKEEEGQISFKYKSNKDQQWHTLTVTAMEFIRRFLQHILPSGFQRVRYYGWLAAAAQTRWERILALLDWTTPPRQVPTPKAEPLCPHCGGPLFWVATLNRGPP